MESVVWVSVCWTFFLSLKKYQRTEGKPIRPIANKETSNEFYSSYSSTTFLQLQRYIWPFLVPPNIQRRNSALMPVVVYVLGHFSE